MSVYPSPPVPSTSGRRRRQQQCQWNLRRKLTWRLRRAKGKGPATKSHEHACSTVRQTVVKRVVGE
eukprot:10619975-Prorocentrum_lima.AAC.1